MDVAIIRQPTTASKLKALLEGYRGARVWDYQLWRSNRNGEKLERLETVAGGEINVSNSRENSWELGLALRETDALNIFADYVKVVIRLYDGIDDYWHEFPFGLYAFRNQKGEDDTSYSEWDLTGYSLEQVLLDDMATAGYKAGFGNGCLQLVKGILTNRYGIDPQRIIFPPTDVTLASDIFFTPWQDAQAAHYLNICNSILAAGGFYALWTDGDGNFRTAEVETEAEASEDVRYGNGPGADALIQGRIGWEYSAENFGNVFTIYAGDSNVSPPVVGSAELHATQVPAPNAWTQIVVDPTSRFSIEALGYRKQAEPEMLENIVSTAVAKRLAARRLKLAAGYEKKMSINTLFDPRRGPREVYRLYIKRDNGDWLYDEKVRVDSFSVSLDFEGGGMRHEVAKVVSG